MAKNMDMDSGADYSPMPELSLRGLFIIFLRHWKGLFVIGFAGAVLGVAASFLVEKTYTVSVLVAMTEGDKMKLPSAISSSGLGGLAAMAGLAPPAGEDRSEALAILQSDSFLGRFIDSRQLKPALYPSRWDTSRLDWKGGHFGSKPTLRASIREFRKNSLVVDEDPKSGLIRIMLTWSDPSVAADVCNALVEDLNDTMRLRRIRDAETRVSALQEQLGVTITTEVRSALFSLLQQDLKLMTLAKTRKDFALMILDPAQTPDEYDRAGPQRFLWLFMGGFLGGAIGILSILIRQFLRAR